MKQLKLTESQLKDLGFKKYFYKDEESGKIKTIFSLYGGINNEIYYNPNEERCVWYYKTILGSSSNHVCLDITSKGFLLTVLQTFRFEFNFE